ncbi:MAG: DinB superfamily protein [Gemmatimonadota bacterium]|nr:MAG: DinB superfamily protein [Gemmatimonadota bacterium]
MTSIESVKRVLIRDLAALRDEVRAYSDELDLWICPEGIVNSASNLVLHLTGNVLHYIGAGLGKTRYVRDRAAEFGSRNVPRVELEARIEQAIDAVRCGMDGLDSDDMEREYPLEAGGGIGHRPASS